ncbi:MAG: sigma-70 family RNA polymerase sigma factor [Alistipes sp.]|nr:sigma-70 family RNA polymerase sigma factor [Alistipes sp.]
MSKQTTEQPSLPDLLRSEEGLSGAFDELVERYGERLYWHIRRIVVSHEDAEDALQEAFVTAYISVREFRGSSEGSLIAWLYKVATTSAIKALKRRRRWSLLPLDSLRGELLATYEQELAPDADEIQVRLQRAVLSLPLKQRLVFNMRYYDELPFERIAAITGDSLSTLKTNYHYAVRKVRERVSVIEIDE